MDIQRFLPAIIYKEETLIERYLKIQYEYQLLWIKLQFLLLSNKNGVDEHIKEEIK